MRLCDKHQTFLDSEVDLDDQCAILSKYNEALDIASYQDSIDYRKNNCQICFFGAIGKNQLVKIIKIESKAKLVTL